MKITEILTESVVVSGATTAYHFTLEENLEDIMEYGLDPSWSTDRITYLIVDTGDRKQLKDDLSTIEGWVYASTRGSDSEVILLKIDITGLTIRVGNESNGWWYTKDIISPDRITNVGRWHGVL